MSDETQQTNDNQPLYGQQPSYGQDPIYGAPSVPAPGIGVPQQHVAPQQPVTSQQPLNNGTSPYGQNTSYGSGDSQYIGSHSNGQYSPYNGFPVYSERPNYTPGSNDDNWSDQYFNDYDKDDIPQSYIDKVSAARKSKGSGWGRAILDFVITFVVAIVVVFLLKQFVFDQYDVPSGSMETTIMTNDMIMAEKVSYDFGTPKKGDIVVFQDQIQTDRTLVKRVIATGGQTVDLKDGTVYVDGTALDEPYTNGEPSYPLPTQAPGVTVTFPYTVPDGYLWVMGDNRTNSADSRYFGAIPVSAVRGHVIMTYWPLSDFKFY
ncbi:MAG: signal peptidase I [Coriobacteriales bacterium]|jgi:signal peptidase I|nr:signal peptidase I [Coriobacteriales bacterium]